MRRIPLLAIVLLSVGSIAGCEHPKAYLIDRGRDAADIVTLTVGLGAGARARMGPLHAGLILFADVGGLRGGNLVTYRPAHAGHEIVGTVMADATIWSHENFFLGPNFWGSLHRFKEFEARGLPLLSGVQPALQVTEVEAESEPLVHPYYTQVEAVVALLGGVRAGVNPGEALDFLLGWFGIDIFNDDAEMRKAERESAWTIK